jgi:hypothetical protein
MENREFIIKNGLEFYNSDDSNEYVKSKLNLNNAILLRMILDLKKRIEVLEQKEQK